jgi:DnaJ domain
MSTLIINSTRRRVLLQTDIIDNLALRGSACIDQHQRQRQTERRYYFTNGDIVKQHDPYSILGLSYGDGATTKEIRDAFKRMAAKIHPDVNTVDSPNVALKKFQSLQRAYNILIQNRTNTGNNNEDNDEWRFRIWNQGDRIACDRTDVAGLKRQRPIMPALKKETFDGITLGHPSNGRQRRSSSGEYITDGSTTSRTNNTNVSGGTVGRGFNKWVNRDKIAYVPWNGSASNKK